VSSYHGDYTGLLPIPPALTPLEMAYFALYPDELCYGFLDWVRTSGVSRIPSR